MKDYKHKQLAIDSAETFEELAEIAISILKDMSLAGKPIFQICGPISTGGLGSYEKNAARFQTAIDNAIKNGLYVFHPQIWFEDAFRKIAAKQPKTDEYCMPILDVFYRKIFESGYVKVTLFLPDWQSSKGATWERNLVTELGIEVRDYPLEWLE